MYLEYSAYALEKLNKYNRYIFIIGKYRAYFKEFFAGWQYDFFFFIYLSNIYHGMGSVNIHSTYNLLYMLKYAIGKS